jgi:hypothetical protein
MALSWRFRCSQGRSPVLADQAADDVGVPDAAGHAGRLAELVQRRPLFARLVGAMLVVMPCVLGQDPPEVPFAVDQQVDRGTRGVASPHTAPPAAPMR